MGHEGQALIVQVTKDPIGTKGARLTTQLSIPSRYLVYMPGADHVGVSQRIEEGGERDRLKDLVHACMEGEGLTGEAGFILRTAAEGVGEEEILADTRYLRRLWRKLEERRKRKKRKRNKTGKNHIKKAKVQKQKKKTYKKNILK